MCDVDALIFTAGIGGENSIYIREKICEGLECIGIMLDKDRNQVRGRESIISRSIIATSILVIPTNEELMIARDTLELVGK